MDIRYLTYLGNKTAYYAPSKNSEKDFFEVKDIPESYEFIDGDHWINILNKNLKDFPKQGWKIHVSSDISSAQKTLDIVSELMFLNNTSFKFVKNAFELRMKNSKYGDRASSGKFITIYPKNEVEFINILNILDESLDSSIKAPYVLNDKRWKNSNIYFRYGGFVDIPVYIDGRKTSGIITPKGEIIEDERLPYYTLPYFIEEPKEIKKMNENEIDDNNEKSELDNYDIQEALHFSNGGGVYLALDKQDRKVIIKEGRPGAGLDASDRDAFSRVKNEKYILENLRNINQVVTILDSFDEWEHTFIVEEYIEGMDLYDWLARNYPFYNTIPSEQYTQDSIYILNQLINIIKDIHINNVGMGDLQPANIMISENKSVTLIDFETASTPYDKIHGGLMTVGFAGDLSMNRMQSDWFALLRIAKQLFLPIGPISDISENMNSIHDSWIEDTFGYNAISIIKKIEEKCNSLNTKQLPERISSNGELNTHLNIENMKRKLRNGLLDCLSEKDRLAPGDIRQYEMNGGKVNILTGGFGVAMALERTGGINKIVSQWIENQEIDNLLEMDNGLLTGKSGIASVLWELGYFEKAKKIFLTIQDYEQSDDVSLASGLSGIGLSFLGIYIESKNIDYLKKSIKIGGILKERMDQNVDIVVFDEDIVDKGLICGWSGVSLFYSALYNITLDEKWLELSLRALKKDLNLSIFDDYEAFHIDDSFRLMPYICGGSAGLILALVEYSSITSNNKWENEMSSFLVNSTSKTFYNCGLFRGTTGILAATNLIENYQGVSSKNRTRENLSTLNIHLIEQNNYIYAPGDSCYRLSGDLFSGSAGIIMILNEIIEDKNMTWLPILNLKTLFESHEKSNIKQKS